MSFATIDKNGIDKYITQTDLLINEIKNSKTDVNVIGTKYYVSTDGNDDNDGLSSETAWKTIAKVNSYGFKYGDGVFFKRGDKFRLTSTLNTALGVTYSAYGDGEKPVLMGSIDASGEDKWESTEYENIYRFKQDINGQANDVGSIVINNGAMWGIQAQKNIRGERHDIGRVFNGVEWFDTTAGPFEDQRDLDHDLEYYHNWEENALYLYSSAGNPGKVFDSVELSIKGYGIEITENYDVTIDNLAFFGIGAHAISGSRLRNVKIQYCTFNWIGGSIQGKFLFESDHGLRYGNAVEAWYSCDGFEIHHCYASQIYDCCWTAQYSDAGVMRDVHFHHNVAEFCNTGLEVWQEGGLIENMKLHDNHTRYAGYGWSHQRIGKDGNFFYGAHGLPAVSKNNDVYNNINYFASALAILARPTGKQYYNFHDNIYVMEEGKLLGGLCEYPESSSGEWNLNRGTAFDEATILNLQARGYEEGSSYYLCKKDTAEMLGDMYKLCLPK